MIKKFSLEKGLLLLFAMGTSVMAAGWKIPEQSVNSTALAGAYVANASGADAAYYNPSNMAFMSQGSYFEADMTYVQLTPIKYSGTINNQYLGDVPASATSKRERAVIPAMHYVGKAYGNYRFGLSLTLPGGLSKRWQDGSSSANASTLKAKEFTLEVFDFNPVVSYKINEKLAIATGIRFVYSRGVVKNEGVTVADIGGGPEAISLNRELRGSDLAVAYSLAISYRPTLTLSLAATYRSKVDLQVKGKATLSAVAASTGALTYSDSAAVSVPLPAVLSLATAYKFNEGTTVELEYERAFWSEYKELDFNYNGSIDPRLDGIWGSAKPRNWKDSNSYRIGVTHKLNEKWLIMGGYAYDETPAPKDTISFELPDSDAQIFSLGTKYSLEKNLSLGIAMLYDKKDKVNVDQNIGDLKGEFRDSSAYLVTLGISYKY